MNKRKLVFISVSFEHLNRLKLVLDVISKVVREAKLKPYIFAQEYQPIQIDYKKMMESALSKIDKSVCVIAELSYQAIGAGIELGYAKAKGKPIIYLFNKKAKQSTTTTGISDGVIDYRNLEDLQYRLSPLVRSLIK